VGEYEEHPSTAASWRDGQFVVFPDAEAADLTVWFGAKVGAGGDVFWEGLLAKRTGSDRARVCGVPFWVYDVNLGDEVSLVDSAEGAPVADGIVIDAGNFTFRIIFHEADASDGRWQELMVEFERYDCWFDVHSPGLVGVSAPQGHARSVADLLSAKERSGELQYETGRSRPPGPAKLGWPRTG
jgi:hypothetical protein